MTNSELQWSRLGEALERYQQVTGYEAPSLVYAPGVLIGSERLEYQKRFDEGLARQGEYQTTLNKRFSKAGNSGAVVFEGVKVTGGDAATDGPVVKVPSNYFALMRTFVGQRHEIEPWSDSEPIQDFGPAREMGEHHPKWIDVIVDRKSFEAWIAREIRDWLIDDFRCERVTLDRAKEIAAEAGCQTIESEPGAALSMTEATADIPAVRLVMPSVRGTEVKSWFLKYIAEWPPSKKPPTEDERRAAAKVRFPDRSVSRQRLRDLLSEAPASWRKPGPRKPAQAAE